MKGLMKVLSVDLEIWKFGNLERLENDRIAKRVYGGVCVSSRLVGRPRKRWNDFVNE